MNRDRGLANDPGAAPGSTTFLRDARLLNVLEQAVLPELVNRPEPGMLRIWVPGCGTGEEAYALAMLLLEQTATLPRARSFQIFATDVDTAALATARTGRCPAATRDLGPERLARFFTRDGETQVVVADIRDACIFAKHDLARDPPFTRMDLISCRNVLAHLPAELRQQAVAYLHFSLRRGGLLLLDQADTLDGEGAHLFEAVFPGERIFRRRDVARRASALPRTGANTAFLDASRASRRTKTAQRVAEQSQRFILEELAPPSVVVDARGEIQHLRGAGLQRYLDLPPGAPRGNVVALALRELQAPLTAALKAAATLGRQAVYRDLSVDLGAEAQSLNLVVQPLPLEEETGAAELFLVIFQDLGRAPAHTVERPTGEASSEGRVRHLEAALASAHARLDATSRELASANEVLDDRNDDLQAVSEELQSSQEEFQTSQEELRLVNGELARANTALREADRRKDAFLAVLAHELRNPLAPIRTGIELLDELGGIGDEARAVLTIMKRQTAHLARIVDDLLEVTRIARGKLQVQRERVELGALVERAAEDYRTVLAANGVALEVDARGGPAWVEGDTTRLSQVVGNLLHNACKFTPRGGKVRVTVRRESEGAAVVRIEDDGIGIAAEMLPRLFEPFVQADESLSRSPGGLGLGLSLVKGLVDLHGGSVDVASDGDGKGSAFTIRLPLAPPPLAPPPVAAPRARAPRRVLLIEDNLDAATTLRALLERRGHAVAVAHDGLSALGAARPFAPDVVLCDIGLPGMSGYEVARAFRADAALRDVYLVALSGYATPEDQQQARDAGFAGHVAKPPSLQQIEAVLASAPPRGHRWRATGILPATPTAT